VVFSTHAISGARGLTGELQFHGKFIRGPQHIALAPAREYLEWNAKHVFKTPARQLEADRAQSEMSKRSVQ
jgi:hypothetical protein